MHEPRGRTIRCTNRPVLVGRSNVGGSASNKVLIVAYVKTGSRRFRDKFYQMCRRLGLANQELQSFTGGENEKSGSWITAYEVWGSAYAIEEFTSIDNTCLSHWHDAVDCGLPFRGMGVGEKPKRPPHPLEWRLNLLRRQDELKDAIALHKQAEITAALR